jgi:hypothetical protein
MNAVTTLKGLNLLIFNPFRVVKLFSFLYPALRTGLFILNPFRIAIQAFNKVIAPKIVGKNLNNSLKSFTLKLTLIFRSFLQEF